MLVMTERTFADRLKAVIEADPDLTVTGLSVRSGLSDAAVRRILSGHVKNPRLDTAMKICRTLGTTIEDFMGDPVDPVERDIAALVSRLPEDARHRLLGFGQALLVSED